MYLEEFLVDFNWDGISFMLGWLFGTIWVGISLILRRKILEDDNG